jgi:glycosyltransferase involved in cell wall biosynthesis
MEAMAASKPAVCMDLAGPGMHITADCGIKIPPRCADETGELMAQALERLCQDSKLRAKMGQGRVRDKSIAEIT